MNSQIEEEDWGWFVDIEEELTNINIMRINKDYDDEYKLYEIKKDAYEDFIDRQKYYIGSVCIYILSLFVS